MTTRRETGVGTAPRAPISVPRDPTFLTSKQVADLLQCSEKSVLRWAGQDSTMPCLRIGRLVRFDRERLLGWFRAKTQGLGRPKSHKQAHDEKEWHATA